jgi:hypothetical protein
VDSDLYMGVHSDHLVVQLRMISFENLRIPGTCDEDGIDTARQRGGEDVGNLKADEESESHNHRRVTAVLIISGLRECDIKVRQEGTSIADEDRTEAENGANEAFLNRG